MRAKIEFYPYPPPVTGYTNPALIKRVSSVGRFYDGLRAARWRAERFLGLLAARGSGCALKTSRVSCLLITLSSSSAPTSLSRSITPCDAEFGKLIAEETEKWGKVIKFAGIKAD